MAAKTFDDFQEDAVINPPDPSSPGDPPYWMAPTDYFVGFTSTAPGGERKWSLSAIKEDFKYAFPQLNGATMTVRIKGDGTLVFPSNPSYLAAIPATLVSTSKSGTATYTLTFVSGVFVTSSYAVFVYASLGTEPILSYVTSQTTTQLVINCVDRSNVAKQPAFLSVHLVEQG
jgi:hypothetical protein